ncbi:hypothetical protein FHT03_003737 [Xanthomonas arboricola]|uniref:hypothetical protein n=1 Tax=Xanthomonas cannabis TaxID=1885674 RepID=UPI00161A6858|nr:hypothetical protein [Xanthomonas cannabis]MBB3807699.1 hypothetical protein [Xanthomonas cannabis]
MNNKTPLPPVADCFIEERNPHQAVYWCFLKTRRNDHLDWSLPAHRRETLGGMDAATELQGRTCSVSRDGGRARALQPRHRSTAIQVIDPHDAITPKQNNQDLKQSVV